MKRVFRILRKRFADNPFNGEGAFRFGGRWSSVGTRVAYASEHLSLAMIEYFVHLDADHPPRDLVVAVAEIPASVSRAVLPLDRLPPHWQRTPPPAALSEFGDAFVREARSAALIVPSVLAPGEANWLLNPLHPGFAQVRLLPLERFVYDRRLF